jgi:CRISPR/Cas system-associated protein Csm6
MKSNERNLRYKSQTNREKEKFSSYQEMIDRFQRRKTFFSSINLNKLFNLSRL